MVLGLLALVVEFVLGPFFLVVHVLEAPAVFGNAGQFVGALSSGEIAPLVTAVLAGEFDLTTRFLASGAGTLAWAGLVAGAVGGLDGVGELGGVLDLLG